MRKIHIIIVLMILIALIGIVGCNKNNNDNNEVDLSLDYTLVIEGITIDPIVVTKEQILEIAKTKELVFDNNNPCYPSDKTDDLGNPVPRTLKGVYLDDILEVYADGVVSGAFSAMTIKAQDGYETVLTSDTFNEEHGGSRMIVAYEYEGVILNVNESSGALRAVFADQPANAWVKQLKTIIFSDAALTPPSPQHIQFLELLDNSLQGSFEKTRYTGSTSIEYTYYGISIEKLIEESIINPDEEDKMYLVAWDYITDGTNSFHREYTNWKSYEYYEKAFLVYSFREDGGEIQSADLAPIFEGENINKGMSVKNTLAITVSDTALISLSIAYERYDDNNDNIIAISDILELVNMVDNQAQYKVIDALDNELTLSYQDISQATLLKDGDNYIFVLEEHSFNIKSITKVI